MDAATVVVSAAVGAVVALGANLVVERIEKAKTERDRKAFEEEAHKIGYTRGWFEGREDLMQLFGTQQPQDFTAR